MNFISLPENKEQMEDLYKNFFQSINLNNTFSGISLLQDANLKTDSKRIDNKEFIQYDKIEMPTKGLVNTKVLPIKHDIIDSNTNTNNENTPKQKEKLEDIKKIEDRELNKRLYDNFPRFRNLRSYEKKDLEEKRINLERKKIEYIKNKDKFANGYSFMQKHNKNEEEYFENDEKPNSLKIRDPIFSSHLPKDGLKMSNLKFLNLI